MDNKDVVSMCMHTGGILLWYKNEWNSAICNNVDGLEDIILNEISQVEK